jgi:hypothetical protein
MIRNGKQSTWLLLFAGYHIITIPLICPNGDNYLRGCGGDAATMLGSIIHFVPDAIYGPALLPLPTLPIAPVEYFLKLSRVPGSRCQSVNKSGFLRSLVPPGVILWFAFLGLRDRTDPRVGICK